MRGSKVRVRLETAIAVFAAALGILTIFLHDWIEALTGWDPDHHNGSFEWLIGLVISFMGFDRKTGLPSTGWKRRRLPRSWEMIRRWRACRRWPRGQSLPGAACGDGELSRGGVLDTGLLVVPRLKLIQK
jgi:hypothetical protein